MAQRLKCLPGMQETRVWTLGREDPLEKEMATHSTILAREIPKVYAFKPTFKRSTRTLDPVLYNKWKWKWSRVRLFAIPWTVAYQAPLSMGFSRQEYWSGLPFPSPGDLPDPGIEPGSPALQADALSSEPPTRYAYACVYIHICVYIYTLLVILLY